MTSLGHNETMYNELKHLFNSIQFLFKHTGNNAQLQYLVKSLQFVQFPASAVNVSPQGVCWLDCFAVHRDDMRQWSDKTTPRRCGLSRTTTAAHLWSQKVDMKKKCVQPSVNLLQNINNRHFLACTSRRAKHVAVETCCRHQMETFSALLALCAGNSPVTGEFLAQRPVTRSFDVFFGLRLYKRKAGDLRRHRAHYDVIVMIFKNVIRSLLWCYMNLFLIRLF